RDNPARLSSATNFFACLKRISLGVFRLLVLVAIGYDHLLFDSVWSPGQVAPARLLWAAPSLDTAETLDILRGDMKSSGVYPCLIEVGITPVRFRPKKKHFFSAFLR